MRRNSIIALMAVTMTTVTPLRGHAQGLTILQDAWSGQVGAGGPPVSSVQPSPVPGASPQMFQGLLQQLFPLSPGQVQELRQREEELRFLAARPPSGIIYRPMLRRLRIDVADARARSQSLRLAIGNVSTLVFADSFGNPWPVRSVTVGLPQAYQAQILGEEGRQHMVVVSPLTDRLVQANLLVSLADMNVPLVFAVEGAALSGEVDYVVEMVVEGRSPIADPLPETMAAPLAPTEDRGLQGFVDGVPPSDALRVATDRPDVAVWLWRNQMVVRGAMEVIAPRPKARMRHVSRTMVFLFDRPASSLLMVEESTGRAISVGVRLDRPLDVVSASEAARIVRPLGAPGQGVGGRRE